jgi:hypothetical protein
VTIDWALNRILLALLPERAPLWRSMLGLPFALLLIFGYAAVYVILGLVRED